MKRNISKYVSVCMAVTAFSVISLDIGAQQTSFWGDQGDGTYRNPVIAADFSDPDVARKGNDYYMVLSTFESCPGVTVLYSMDLVNWEIVGGVFDDLGKWSENASPEKMAYYNKGVYAPSIRYHDGKFFVYVNLLEEGMFVGIATDPAGKWEVKQMIDKNGKPLKTNSWTDPCPFWDEDGKAYYATSRPGGMKWYSYLFQMSSDGTQLLDADVDHMNEVDTQYEYEKGGRHALFQKFLFRGKQDLQAKRLLLPCPYRVSGS